MGSETEKIVIYWLSLLVSWFCILFLSLAQLCHYFLQFFPGFQVSRVCSLLACDHLPDEMSWPLPGSSLPHKHGQGPAGCEHSESQTSLCHRYTQLFMILPGAQSWLIHLHQQSLPTPLSSLHSPFSPFSPTLQISLIDSSPTDLSPQLLQSSSAQS